MPQCELRITRWLPQANLLVVRSQTVVRQGLRGFYLLINITDNWLMFNTEVHIYCMAGFQTVLRKLIQIHLNLASLPIHDKFSHLSCVLTKVHFRISFNL